jgi:hypothetical protein
VKHARAALVSTAGFICLLIVLAHELRPYLPWIFGLIIFGYICWLLLRR